MIHSVTVDLDREVSIPISTSGVNRKCGLLRRAGADDVAGEESDDEETSDQEKEEAERLRQTIE